MAQDDKEKKETEEEAWVKKLLREKTGEKETKIRGWRREESKKHVMQ